MRQLLFPLAWIYHLVVFFRHKLFDWGILSTKEFEIPIIGVGNITVGGTGKTPHVEKLIEILLPKYKVAVLSRGYRRKTKGYILAKNDSDASEIGDEPAQIKAKFPSIHVAVDGNRVRGVKNLTQSFSQIRAIILDDSFQHRYIKPGLNILLIDYNRPIYEDELLPVGHLRDLKSQILKADIIIVSKSPKSMKPIDERIFQLNTKVLPYQTVFFTYLKYGNLKSVFKTTDDIIALEMHENKYSVLLITGIANPKQLVEYVQSISYPVNHLAFADHHNFTVDDMMLITKRYEELSGKSKIILTTEKDSFRFLAMAKVEPGLFNTLKNIMYYIPIEIEFVHEEHKNSFNSKILNYVDKNKRNI